MSVTLKDRVVFFFFKQKTACEMRISDWSSDVCSSALLEAADKAVSLDPLNPRSHAMRSSALYYARRYQEAAQSFRTVMQRARVLPAMAQAGLANCLIARKSVWSGQSVSVRVDTGGRRIITKTKPTKKKQPHKNN